MPPTTTDRAFETGRTLTRAERESLYQLINIATDALINQHARQTAIDALSIATVLIEEPNPDQFGIAPGNVPADALPPSYDAESEALTR